MRDITNVKLTKAKVTHRVSIILAINFKKKYMFSNAKCSDLANVSD